MSNIKGRMLFVCGQIIVEAIADDVLSLLLVLGVVLLSVLVHSYILITTSSELWNSCLDLIMVFRTIDQDIDSCLMAFVWVVRGSEASGRFYSLGRGILRLL